MVMVSRSSLGREGYGDYAQGWIDPYNQPVYFQMAIYLIQTYTHMCNNNIEHNNNIKISIFINHKLLQYTH